MLSEIKNLKIALLISGLLLCFAVVPMWPYGYYIFLRLVVCGTSAFGAVILREHEKLSKHFIPLVVIAILFNPFYPIYLTQLIWLIIDLAMAVYFLQLAKKLTNE
jgi:hypothetical protein